MALPDTIPGLYENVRIQNGLKIGGSVASITAANSGKTDWIQQCVSLVSNNSYNVNPVSGQQREEDQYTTTPTKTSFLKPVFDSNTSWILTVGQLTYRGVGVDASKWQGEYNYYNKNSGALNTYTGTTYTNASNVYPVIDGEDKEHFIGVVRVSARNKNGQNWLGSLKDYRTQQANYPYVTQATIQYYYKADLSRNSMTQISLGWLAVPKHIASPEMALASPQSNYNRYRDTYIGDVDMGMGQTLLQATSLANAVVSALGEPVGYRSVANDSCSSFPFTPMQYFSGEIGIGVETPIQPFCYFTITDVEKAANSRGLWWAEDQTEAQNNAKGSATTSPYVHAPMVTADGATTVLSQTGTNIYENWETEGYRNAGGITIIYNYNINNNSTEDQSYMYENLIDVNNPDPTGDNPDLEIGSSTYTGVGCFSTYYAMNIDNIISLNDELWTSDEDWYHALLEGLRLWGADPMQAIMSMRLYPFDVAVATGVTTAQNDVYFGRVMMTTKAAKIPANATVVLDLGETWINAKNLGLHGDFRDYAPYTAVTLYIPFIGCTQINVNDFMNTAMKIRMVVDITTGSCTAVVYSVKDGHSTPYLYLPGTIGVDIPITLDTMTEVAVSLLQGTMGLAMGAVAGGAVAMGVGIETQFEYGGFTDQSEMPDIQSGINPDSYAKREAMNIGNTASNILFGKSSMDRTGNASPAASLAMPLYCYLIVSTPTWERPENYDHTYGKICHVSGTLGSFHGYTICRNPDLTGINCAKMEQNMIKHYLESGVYL